MNVFNVVYNKPERKKKLLSQHNKNHNEFEARGYPPRKYWEGKY